MPFRSRTGACAFNTLESAVARLKRGGVAVFPTDTVTGIGCLAGSRAGVRLIYSLKRRNRRKPLILFVRDMEDVERISGRLDGRIKRLLRLAWPGALTAILPLKAVFPRGVGRGKTVGVRIPNHRIPRDLLRRACAPLATTSANLSGTRPFRDAAQAGKKFGRLVAVIRGRAGRVPSTIADLTRWPPRVVRRGSLSRSRLKRLVARAEACRLKPLRRM